MLSKYVIKYTLGSVYSLQEGAKTVSYTHLDVYKRQV